MLFSGPTLQSKSFLGEHNLYQGLTHHLKVKISQMEKILRDLRKVEPYGRTLVPMPLRNDSVIQSTWKSGQRGPVALAVGRINQYFSFFTICVVFYVIRQFIICTVNAFSSNFIFTALTLDFFI